MSSLHLPTLILDAFFRPSRLATFVAEQPNALAWAALTCGEVLVATVGLLALLGMFIPLGVVGLVIGPGLALAIAVMGAFLPIFTLPLDLSTQVRLIFGFIRSFIVTGPPTALVLVIIFSPAFPSLQRDPFVVLLLLVALGIWLGGACTMALLISSRRHEPLVLRWLGVVGALLLGALIWRSEALRQSDGGLFVPFLAGFSLGLLRPLSYLWEAPLSLMLALVARFRAPAHRLLALHPVSFDELCLLPQPGLVTLLTHACTADITVGGPWLIQVAAHPSQGWVARRALARLVKSQRAHAVLFWLSTETEGAAWLQQLSLRVDRPHPLIAAYAALAAVGEPAAWPSVIAAHRGAISAASCQPGGGAVRALLEAGTQVLSADRWSVAMLALQASSPPHGGEPDPLWSALEFICEWSDSKLPTLLPDRARAFAALWELIDQMDGWPAALIEAMAEQLAYLLTVEHRRGAWLV